MEKRNPRKMKSCADKVVEDLKLGTILLPAHLLKTKEDVPIIIMVDAPPKFHFCTLTGQDGGGTIANKLRCRYGAKMKDSTDFLWQQNKWKSLFVSVKLLLLDILPLLRRETQTALVTEMSWMWQRYCCAAEYEEEEDTSMFKFPLQNMNGMFQFFFVNYFYFFLTMI